MSQRLSTPSATFFVHELFRLWGCEHWLMAAKMDTGNTHLLDPVFVKEFWKQDRSSVEEMNPGSRVRSLNPVTTTMSEKRWLAQGVLRRSYPDITRNLNSTLRDQRRHVCWLQSSSNRAERTKSTRAESPRTGHSTLHHAPLQRTARPKNTGSAIVGP